MSVSSTNIRLPDTKARAPRLRLKHDGLTGSA